ncbi:hypothetical protein H5410_053172 [Solanum commersonii]|uniref:Uncharacterized protein n=1 Tax=Solanum commersonii TaxID=4109 RepID=A0A9J5X2T9_SOLCO|nr:hypothetical protein H5410_053172 [Solanum commersonii]
MIKSVCAELPDPYIDHHLYKLVTKHMIHGHDKIAFSVHNSDTNVEIDEIKEYQSARWVSPRKPHGRLFAFSISEMTPSACQLQLILMDNNLFLSKITKPADR